MRIDSQSSFGQAAYLFACAISLSIAFMLFRLSAHGSLFASALYSLKLLLSSIPICIIAIMYTELNRSNCLKIYTKISMIFLVALSVAILLMLSFDLSLNIYVQSQFDQEGTGSYLARLEERTQ